MLSAPLTIAACLGAALLATLVLASFLTPRHWWRRANARALAVLAAGTAGIGCLLLQWAGVWPTHQHVPQALASPVAILATGSYHAHDDLNLRAASGTGAARIAVVPAGAVVTTTGARDGDWWEVKTTVDGRPVRGWASSLWLRRSEEAHAR